MVQKIPGHFPAPRVDNTDRCAQKLRHLRHMHRNTLVKETGVAARAASVSRKQVTHWHSTSLVDAQVKLMAEQKCYCSSRLLWCCNSSASAINEHLVDPNFTTLTGADMLQWRLLNIANLCHLISLSRPMSIEGSAIAGREGRHTTEQDDLECSALWVEWSLNISAG